MRFVSLVLGTLLFGTVSATVSPVHAEPRASIACRDAACWGALLEAVERAIGEFEAGLSGDDAEAYIERSAARFAFFERNAKTLILAAYNDGPDPVKEKSAVAARKLEALRRRYAGTAGGDNPVTRVNLADGSQGNDAGANPPVTRVDLADDSQENDAGANRIAAETGGSPLFDGGRPRVEIDPIARMNADIARAAEEKRNLQAETARASVVAELGFEPWGAAGILAMVDWTASRPPQGWNPAEPLPKDGAFRLDSQPEFTISQALADRREQGRAAAVDICSSPWAFSGFSAVTPCTTQVARIAFGELRIPELVGVGLERFSQDETRRWERTVLNREFDCRNGTLTPSCLWNAAQVGSGFLWTGMFEAAAGTFDPDVRVAGRNAVSFTPGEAVFTAGATTEAVGEGRYRLAAILAGVTLADAVPVLNRFTPSPRALREFLSYDGARQLRVANWESLPQSLRIFGERHYGITAEQASPSAIARMAQTSSKDPVWWSDHGIDHMKDVVTNVSIVLDQAQHGGLIAARSHERGAFMHALAGANAVLHDMWMKDLTPAGRKLHPQRAAREAFSEELDEVAVDLLRHETVDGKTIGDLLVGEYGIPQDQHERVIRELLAMSYGHSKSLVPLHMLDDPARLRQEMIGVIADESDTVTARPYRRFYNDGAYEAEAFDWIAADSPLTDDMTDVARALRLGDAFRMRGTADFRGSQGANIVTAVVDGEPTAVMRLADRKTGQTYLVRYANTIVMGETNIANTMLDGDGNLVVEISKGFFGSAGNDATLAAGTAHTIIDVYRDYIGSFAQAQNRRFAVDLPIQTTDEFEVALRAALFDMAKKEGVDTEMLTRNLVLQRGLPDPAAMGGLAHRVEHRRFEAGHMLEDSGETARAIEPLLRDGGVDTSAFDLEAGLRDARIIKLKDGDILFARNDPGAYVYIPLEGQFEIGIGGTYRPIPARLGVPVGELSVLTGNPRTADYVASGDARLIAVPAATYRQHWTRGIYSHETIIPRLRRDEALKSLRSVTGPADVVPTADGLRGPETPAAPGRL